MSEQLVFPPAPGYSGKAYINSIEQYHQIYKNSVSDPEQFWSEIAERISWFKKWDKVCDYDFINAEIRWFEGQLQLPRSPR